MNNKQGFHPINGKLTDNELFAPAFFLEKEMSDIIEQKIHVDGNALAKTILCVCEECEGPTTPLSSCLVCKRISQRKCNRCENRVSYGSHLACEYLVLLGTLRSDSLVRKKKNGVDL